MDARLEHVYQEKERIGKLSHIREIIFGAQDGLLVPLGVVTTVAGAFNNNHFVIVAGISEALAGAFSMATGAYLSSQAESQVHKAEIEKESVSIRRNLKEEQLEMILLFEREGVSHTDAIKLTNILKSHHNSFKETMIQKELGLNSDPPGTAMGDAIMVGLSYLVAASIPLFPYFFLDGIPAIITSMAATFIALFCIGLLKGKLAALPFLKSGFEVLLIGAGSGIGGYLLGTILPKILHLE